MIGIYVGTFNPITEGHKEVAKATIDKYNLEKVIFVPVSNKYEKDELIDINHRINMINLSISEDEKLEVSNIEKLSPKQLKTYEILKIFQNIYPDKTLHLIIGADNFVDLPKWFKVDKMLQEFNIIVLKRNNLPIRYILNTHPLFKNYKNKFLLIEDFNKNISSSIIRNQIKSKENVELDLFNEEVLKYINENDLYKE